MNNPHLDKIVSHVGKISRIVSERMENAQSVKESENLLLLKILHEISGIMDEALAIQLSP